ncbi:MAG: YwpF family protein [Bacillota bacterium]|nr:YwpF family protein [Bacillota bacterium]
MKTFKLISLNLLEDDTIINIPLEDGLIINKEDENSTWLIEAYTDLSHYDQLQKFDGQEKDIIVQVVITKKENDPAYFQTRISSLKKFTNKMSIMLEGHLRRSRNEYSELLLERLLEKGLHGEELLTAFKEQIKRKPLLK